MLIEVGERKILIKGVGKLFYERGLPVSITIDEMSKKGIEVSIFHVADECLKHGWSKETTYKKLKEDLFYDFPTLKDFIFADYEKQREMINEYLFENVNQEQYLRNLLCG